MSRFLGGLNQEIQDKLETEHYMELEDMLHKAILFEQQIKRKRVSRSSYSHSSSYTRPGYSKEDRNSFAKDFKPAVYSKPPEATKVTTPAPADYKGKAKESVVRSRDVSCFKCHGKGHYASECSNRRVMILLESGEVESADEYPATSNEEERELLAVKGKLMVARRMIYHGFYPF
ncbi:hypothetical protein V5N11_014311 [Cardamine amara subsp. amara]|uniref:CCHC-type domain-containing protein n=1 Tax=Cardamine amara subsp. amara TaxID=228776 RepID=A0ABD0Z4A3_CARAN